MLGNKQRATSTTTNTISLTFQEQVYNKTSWQFGLFVLPGVKQLRRALISLVGFCKFVFPKVDILLLEFGRKYLLLPQPLTVSRLTGIQIRLSSLCGVATLLFPENIYGRVIVAVYRLSLPAKMLIVIYTVLILFCRRLNINRLMRDVT